MIALWDLGNVVVQWNPDKIMEMLDLPAERAALVRSELIDSSLWLDLDRGVTTEADVAKHLANTTDLQPREVHHCCETVRDSLVDLPATLEMIQRFSKASVPMYVLSNMSVVNYQYLRARPYFDLFSGVVVSAEEKLLKPDLKLFQLVLDRYNLKAQDVVFIDDMLPNIESAKSIGMQGVHFKRSDDCYAKIESFFSGK